VGTHWLLVHTSPAMQPAQSKLRPQPSPTVPQYLREPAPHVLWMHVASPIHWWSSQIHPLEQSPQVMVPPHPLPSAPPQYWPPEGLQDSAVQPAVDTHWLFWHVSSAAHPPHVRTPPQPSPMLPQYLPTPVPHAIG
jgi:hypothetical protein